MSKRLIALPAMLLAVPAQGADVSLTANVLNSCVLTINSNGVMTASADGRTLGSENGGGSPSTLNLVATGLRPTVTFGAPALTTRPSEFTADALTQIRYTSSNGANQAYTSGASSAQTALLDSFTVHGRVTSDAGFAAGNYTLRTVATCSQ